MFRDVKDSQRLNLLLRNELKPGKEDFWPNFMLVSSHAWPFAARDCREALPKRAREAFEDLATMYDRKEFAVLAQAGSASAEIEMYSNSRRIFSGIVHCTTSQMIILWMFTQASVYSVNELMKKTKFTLSEVRNVLKPILSADHPILVKRPSDSAIALDDRIQPNSEYNGDESEIKLVDPNLCQHWCPNPREDAVMHAIDAFIRAFPDFRNCFSNQLPNQVIEFVKSELGAVRLSRRMRNRVMSRFVEMTEGEGEIIV